MQPLSISVAGRSLVIRPARVQEILPLRRRILRAGLPAEAAEFPGDEETTTLHGGVFDLAEAVACASFYVRPWDGRPAWQLRGMAADDGWQGRGVGGQLLSWAEGRLMEVSPVRQLWCNARVSAIGFYEKQGWRVCSEEFTIETAGPHRKMVKNLERQVRS